MIAYLEGTVKDLLPPQQIILLVGQIGYLVTLTTDTLSKLQPDQTLALSIHTHVREDELSLYGFQDVSSMKFFQQLISVSGIGPKTALGILNMPIHQVMNAIQSEDIPYLSQAPGLGKKTAARLVLELKNKLDLETLPSTMVPRARALQEEALDALLNLGYDKGNVIRFFNSTELSFQSSEEAVMLFLQQA